MRTTRKVGPGVVPALAVALALTGCVAESGDSPGDRVSAMADAGEISGGEGENEHRGNLVAEAEHGDSEGRGEHGDSGEHSEQVERAEAGEHAGGGEHAGEEGGHDEGGGEGEESGVYVARDATWDAVRRGARLVLSFDPESEAFVGTVENTTDGPLCDVRVEVHLSTGTELGPTPRTDLPSGQTLDVQLRTGGEPFESWTAHPELSACGDR